MFTKVFVRRDSQNGAGPAFDDSLRGNAMYYALGMVSVIPPMTC